MPNDHSAETIGGPWGGVLVVHFGTHGHTSTFAGQLAVALRAAGLEVDVRTAAAGAAIDPDRHDAIVIGASLHREPQRDGIVAWIRSHRVALAGRPTALFSVRLTGTSGEAEERDEAERAMRELVAQTGWEPDRAVAITDHAALERLADELALLAAAPAAA